MRRFLREAGKAARDTAIAAALVVGAALLGSVLLGCERRETRPGVVEAAQPSSNGMVAQVVVHPTSIGPGQRVSGLGKRAGAYVGSTPTHPAFVREERLMWYVTTGGWVFWGRYSYQESTATWYYLGCRYSVS